MGKFLTYSELDTAIQRKLSNQAPDEDTRLEAINDSVSDIYAEYDIDTGKREFNFYAVPNGEEIPIEDQVSDFKRVSDLRYLNYNNHDGEFVYRDDDEFQVNIGRGVKLDEYSVLYNDGLLYLKVNSSNGITSVGIHTMGDIDDNGTWTADSDAENVAEEEVTTLSQGTSIRFDIDVSNSANNYAMIYNADMDDVDLEDYDELGRFRFWIYLPSVTDFTSVEFRWGNDSSNYFYKAVTEQMNGTALQVGWNRVEFDWSSATETGSVTVTAIDYIAIKLNYAAGFTDQTKVVVEAINCYLPVPFKMVYHTYYKSQTSAGTFQDDLTTTATDTILLPQRFKKLVLLKSLQYLAPIALGDDMEIQIRKWRSDEQKELSNLGLDIGKKVKTPVRKIKLRVQ